MENPQRDSAKMSNLHTARLLIGLIYNHPKMLKTSEGGTGLKPVPPSSKFLFFNASYSSSARALASAITAASIWPGSCS